jgi:hypothetical protein
VAKNEIAWPQYYQGNGWESEFSRSWGINSVPHFLLVDAQGKLAVTNAKLDALVAIPAAVPGRSFSSVFVAPFRLPFRKASWQNSYLAFLF